MSETTDRVAAIVNAFDARIQATPEDRWANPSPCDDWTARDVVAHVANNFLRLTAGLAGAEPQEVGADEDIKAAWARAQAALSNAMATADLSKNVAGPFGPMPAEQMLGRLLATDALVHTWDLARAVGGDERLDPAAVSGAHSGLKPMDAMIRLPGVFGPKTTPPADADEQTEFLCFLGRAV